MLKLIIYIGIILAARYFFGIAGALIAGVIVATAAVIIDLPTVYMVLGDRRQKKGDTAGGFKYFEKAVKTGRLNAAYTINYAYRLLREAELVRSKELLEGIIESEKTTGADKNLARLNLALVDWKSGDLESAVKLTETAHEGGKSGLTYGNLGMFYVLSGDYEKALEFNLEAYDYMPSDNTICDNLGETYYHLGRYDEALEIYRALINRLPQSPTPYYNYARTLEAAGETADALEYYQKALKKKFPYLCTTDKETVKAKVKELTEE